MDYKKVLIIKQLSEGFGQNGKSVSGICRAEIEGGVFTLSLSFINLCLVSSGEYFAYLLFPDKTLFPIELGNRPISITKTFDHNFNKEFCVGLFFVKDDLPVLVGFSSTSPTLDASLLKKSVIDKLLNVRKNKKSGGYDDEAVATENYYLLDGFDEKTALLGGIDNEHVWAKTNVSNQSSEEKTQEKPNDTSIYQNETDQNKGAKYSKTNPYYLSAKQELEGIFLKFPSEESLSKMVENSRWAKINYTHDKYYVVGVVKENDKEKYICYGVPAPYSIEPPKELKGYCSFVPLSIFDLKGKGYWMMFQDANTGECVKLNG